MIKEDKKNILPVGKLKMERLSRLLQRYKGAPDSSVVVGPEIGEDAAVIEINETLLIAKTDPITFATDRIGEYLINVNANDIACMGGNPKWFLATVLLPENKTDDDLVEKLFSQMSDACSSLGIAICGGHTEVTHGLERPIVVGQMLGLVPKERFIRSSGAKPGDHILLTKGVAVEATCLIAREKENELTREFDRNFINSCKKFLRSPGISILKDATVALDAGGVKAMHDPTEGGVATGLHELAMASKVGIEVYGDKIPLFPETRKLCRFFNLDPLGVIASGALLIVAKPDSSEGIMGALISEGIQCVHIGVIKEKSEGTTIIKTSKRHPLPCFDQDEISKIF
jgi:hydrogenase maturation factor